jgi:hypothetical protein
MFAAGVPLIKNIIILAKIKLTSMHYWYKLAFALLNLPILLEQTQTEPTQIQSNIHSTTLKYTHINWNILMCTFECT